MTDLHPAVTPNIQLGFPQSRAETALANILSNLQDAELAADVVAVENQLLSVRLGVASALYEALRIRHKPTAAHSLRVAMGCSSWGLASGMDSSERDEIEVAALLHDIGKIGTPDNILRQATSLSAEQAHTINQSRMHGLQILSACCNSPNVLKTIAYVGAWFDGSRREFSLERDDIPVGSRMIAIVDAYDAMTTDRVYRRAMSRERAIAELYECAGTQFDAYLVDQFASIEIEGRLDLDQGIVNHWLRTLRQENSNQYWQLNRSPQTPTDSSASDLHFEQLVASIHEGVFFVGADGEITQWNRAAEKMTGISSASILTQKWDPTILKMKHGTGRIVRYENCPVYRALQSGLKSRDQIMVRSGEREFIHVDLQVLPIVSRQGSKLGVITLMRDASSELDLEERVEELRLKATSDSLTGLSNRAEFDRTHKEAIEHHTATGTTCSLIICDIDRFKWINDVYGHQAGDQALVSFSGILQRRCRIGDLVARYGGEEFVMVCHDCNSADATKIAESVRQELEVTNLSELGGRAITASFGVTEMQPGDSPETMLRRADRGLLQAKDTGRNRVVQLGSGMDAQLTQDMPAKKNGWWPWPRTASAHAISDYELSTNVPLPLVVEKLRGFVADHDAEIVSITQQQVVIAVTTASFQKNRRSSDRPMSFQMQIDFIRHDERDLPSSPTTMRVLLHPTKMRDRRDDPEQSAKELIRSLQSYMVAQLVRHSA